MPRLRPDPTFYASPSLATEAPAEQLAYVALLASRDGQRDGRDQQYVTAPPAPN